MAMPAAWKAGYDWANGNGKFAGMDANEAAEAAGYYLDDEENSILWNAGAEAAQNEMVDMIKLGESQ